MSGNDSSDDDLVMGRTNHAQDPTRLFANEDGQTWGDGVGDNGGPVLDVQTGDMARPGGGLSADTAINAVGSSVGVVGSGNQAGVVGSSNAGIGVRGDAGPAGGTGVKGTGNPGVRGETKAHGDNAVEGIADTGPGAPPTQLPQIGAGVYGHSVAGTGVRGSSERGRGGMFSSDSVAQLHLTPRWHSNLNRLPCSGQAGDLLMCSPLAGEGDRDPNPEGKASLWVCIRSSEGDVGVGGDGVPAVWARVQFDIVHTCREGAPPLPPDHSHGG